MTQRAFRVIEGGCPAAPRSTWLARIRSGFLLAGEMRRGRRHLAGLDGRMLADIGASRSDARAEAARPWWDTQPPPPDPTRRRAR